MCICIYIHINTYICICIFTHFIYCRTVAAVVGSNEGSAKKGKEKKVETSLKNVQEGRMLSICMYIYIYIYNISRHSQIAR